jgi:hypothetical protein
MGGEKFHITVTIDNEKALQISELLDFLASGILLLRNKSQPQICSEKSTRSDPGPAFQPEIFLSRSAIKAAMVVGISSADICGGALAL